MIERRPLFRTICTLLVLFLPVLLAAQERELGLEAFLELVESNSLELKAARTDRSLAEVREQLTRSQLFPTVGGQLGYRRNLLDITQPVPVYAVDDPTYPPGVYRLAYEEVDVTSDNELTAGLSLQQKLFDMSVFRALEASEQYTSLTGTAFEAARQGILTEAKRLYFQTLLLEEVLSVRRSSEEIAYDNYQDTRKRYESGVASRMEVLRAEVNWKITQPNTTQAERNLQVALQNLKNLAGLPNNTELSLQGSLESYPELPEDANAAAVRMNRPDYRILMSQRELRKLNIDATRASFYPTLSASVEYGLQAGSDELDFSDPTDTLTVGISMTVPLFYGGSRFAQLRQARLELQQTDTQIARKESNIFTELENIRLRLQEADQRIESAQQTLNTAEEAYNVTVSSVESGLATQLELKDARVSLEQARLSYVSAVFDYLSAYFDWQRAVGKGTQLP